MVVFELVQALKFKTTIPDSNLLMLINLILQVNPWFMINNAIGAFSNRISVASYSMGANTKKIKNIFLTLFSGYRGLYSIKCCNKRLFFFSIRIRARIYNRYIRLYEIKSRRYFRIFNRFSCHIQNEGK